MNRPSWDEYFMQITHLVATRATCLRRKVGAILVRDKHILTTGYNGPPAGVPHCDELGGCLRDKLNVASGERHELSRAVHAEQNAIIQAAIHGISIKGATLYATNQPCSLCTKMLVNAGIREFVISDGYPDDLANDIMEQAGVTVRKIPAPESADLLK
ncbi:cytidine deaminase [candidate division LCP-89 bacterium B3_LCP]|uniref:Cytidine deaminase n=1 Tax=candidate division LCP-89 bacterium B3_LCP TaxID=2012998 RepID=A0A532V0W9_UNCL8|nr:MAG: cytidine deaminase [candidate division LCP-89 bacterium B3_LCP]